MNLHRHLAPMRRRSVLLAAASVCAGPVTGRAQSYPAKPIKVIVNSAPGGLTDIVARMVGMKMSASMGQPFVVDNRPGGVGLVGAEAVSKAEADGYTVGVVASAITVAPSLVPGSNFSASRDLAPVAMVMTSPLILVTGEGSPYKSVAQAVADAKARPGEVAIASGGNGTMTHLLAEQFQVSARIKLIHVAYKGGGPALIAVMAGQVPLYFDTLSTSVKPIQEGRVRGLAIVAPKRSPQLPDVPTIAEAGFPQVEGNAWYALVAPPHTPAAIIARLNEEAGKALAAPDVKERITALGGNVEGGSPRVLADLIASETPRWAKLVKDRGIKL